MIAYADFVPRQTSGGGMFRAAEYDSFDAALRAANNFVSKQSVRVLNIETVVLPNMWNAQEEGTADASLRTSGEYSTTWHQFIRVWYDS